MVKYKPGDVVICMTSQDGYIKGQKYLLLECNTPYCYIKDYNTRLVVHLAGKDLNNCQWIYHPVVYKIFHHVNTKKRNHLPEWMR